MKFYYIRKGLVYTCFLAGIFSQYEKGEKILWIAQPLRVTTSGRAVISSAVFTNSTLFKQENYSLTIIMYM